MQIFDAAFGALVKERLSGLPEDVTPQWGTMNRGQLYGHLDGVLRYTMGENPDVPYRGNFKTRHIFRHIILFGLKEIPHNIKVPRPTGVSKEQFFPEIEFSVLDGTITSYLERVPIGTLPTRIHPFFGPLSPSNWQRFHRLHFIHHMKQFAIAEGI